MPLNLNKTYRYQLLDKCLRDSTRLFTMEKLKDACNSSLRRKGLKGCSLRTYQNDIKLLQEPPFEMELDASALENGYYQYADSSQKLPLLDLSKEEKNALEKTIEVLGPICKGSCNSQYLWMYHCLRQLQQGNELDLDESNISFGVNEDFTGMKFFSKAMDVVSLRKPVELHYKPYTDVGELVFHLFPYHLRQYNNRWFLLGKAEEREGISNFALDRIIDIKPWKTNFESSDVDFFDYFFNIVGVSVPEDAKVEEIKLKISNSRFPYLDTKPIHGSYKELKSERTDTYHVIRLELAVNNEFIALLLSLGPDAEVLSPQWLRDTIAEKASELYKKYYPAQKTCAEKQ